MRLILLSIMFLLTSCVNHFPSEDIYFRYYDHMGEGLIEMEKGYLDETNEGKTWMKKKDYKESI